MIVWDTGFDIIMKKIAIITSSFNKDVTDGLLWGVDQVFKKYKIKKQDVIYIQAPGAFELPLLAKKVIQKKKVSGVICLGCVIKGDTAHFEFISLAAATGIQQVAIETGVPVGFGILTTYKESQANKRSRKDQHNKGIEAAEAVLQVINTLKKM